MTVSIPTDIGSGRVFGQIIKAVLDTPDDADSLPDAVPAEGSVTFTPTLVNPAAHESPDLLIMPMPVTVQFGPETLGTFDVWLISNQDPDMITASPWAWKVEFNIIDVEIQPIVIDVPVGSEQNIKDWLPAAEVDGTLTLRGPRGYPTFFDVDPVVTELPYGSTPTVTIGAETFDPVLEEFIQTLGFGVVDGRPAPVCIETTPGTYTARLDATPHLFIGSTDPTAIMLDNDVWMDNSDPNTSGAPPAAPLYGNGSPETVQVAPIGTEYIDLSATNGARKWYKASGTGNTGWIVTQGDTGQRTALSWDAAGNMTKGVMGSTDWGPDGLQAGGLWVQRKGDVVLVTVERVKVLAASGSGPMYTLPVGFRPARGYRMLTDMYVNGSGTPSVRGLVVTGGGLVVRGSNVSTALNEVVVQTSWTYITPDAWPTTLP